MDLNLNATVFPADKLTDKIFTHTHSLAMDRQKKKPNALTVSNSQRLSTRTE